MIYIGQTFQEPPIIKGVIMVNVFECDKCHARQTTKNDYCFNCDKKEKEIAESQEVKDYIAEEKTK